MLIATILISLLTISSSEILYIIYPIESKARILKDDNTNAKLENDVDINNWQEGETIANKLDNLISLSSLGPEHTRTLLASKMALYNSMLEKLSVTKLQTGHSHSH